MSRVATYDRTTCPFAAAPCTMRGHHASHHMSNCTYLPDLPPDPRLATDYWVFADESGSSDWTLSEEELPSLHAIYASFGPYTVQRQPGVTDAQLAQAALDRLESTVGMHPSLSPSERNTNLR